MARPIDAYKDLGAAELVSKLAEVKEEMFNLRFQLATGQAENSARVGHLKREVARINTVLRAREIEAADALGGKK
jgi:large subunit ribosomal protein L29